METIKLLTNLGEPLLGRMLRFDLRDMTFHTLQVRRNPLCPCCAQIS